MKATDLIKESISKVCQELGIPVIPQEVMLEHPGDYKFGDVSTNIALNLARSEKKNPREIALTIAKKIEEKKTLSEFVEKVEVAGAGFINFYLKKSYLAKIVEEINYEFEFLESLKVHGKNRTMVIDYSAPNIAKPFGIGHLRSTNIGQSIYNIYKTLGWNCIGDNHLGDWGTQFGKLIASIKHWGDKDISEMKIEDLEKLYVRFHKEAETDQSLIEEGREWFSKLEKGDEEARSIWQKCVEISISEFNRVYEMLGVKIDFTHGEAFYESMLNETIEALKDKKITTQSQGALIVEFEDMPPAMVTKSNGATTYFTRDMATVKYRMENWKPDLIVYEVGVDQDLHFRQVFKSAEMLGWVPSCGFVHVAHGLIRWKTGKFSTRKGDTIHLADVIDKAMEEAMKIADKSLVGKTLEKKEKEEMVKNVAIGAIKFNDLSQDPRKDVIFDWDKVMSLEGDSGPYLQYTFSRCNSVLSKTEIKETKNIDSIPNTMESEEEILLKEIAKFEEKILEAAKRFSPAVVAEYLLGVARSYNEFYAKHKIIGHENEVFRLFLTRSTASVLRQGLGILGIKTVERM